MTPNKKKVSQGISQAIRKGLMGKQPVVSNQNTSIMDSLGGKPKAPTAAQYDRATAEGFARGRGKAAESLTIGQQGDRAMQKYRRSQDMKSFGKGGTGAGLSPQQRRAAEMAYSRKKRQAS